MKHCLLGLILVMTMNAYSRSPEEKKALLESQTSCSNFVRFDENHLYQGYGPYKLMFEDPRSPIPGKFTVTSFDTKETQTLQTNDSAIDIVVEENHAFVLTYSGIEEWDLTTQQKVADHPTHTQTAVTYKEHAESFARYQDQMIIAHGRLGVSFFDLKTKKITGTIELIKQQAPLESQATAVSIIGKLAYVTMDSLSLVTQPPRPFTGIVVIDMEKKKVVSELKDLDIGSDAVASFGNKLIVSFYGFPIWKYDVSLFKGKNLPAPQTRLFRMPYPGHPIGAAEMDEKYYYTCYHFRQTEESPAAVKPMALNRKVLLLD
jgi:hypothetical protein